MTSTDTREKPVLVMGAFPAAGHMSGPLQIAEHLVGKGYTVYFVAGTEWHDQVASAGAQHVDNPYVWVTPEVFHAMAQIEDANEQTLWAVKNVFLAAVPPAFRALRRCLEDVRARLHPGRDVVIINEGCFGGVLPYYYGAPLPEGYDELPRVVNFHPGFNFMDSADVFPFLFGPTQRATDEESRAAVARANATKAAAVAPLIDHANEIYRSLGATKLSSTFYLDEFIMLPEISLMPYSASVDFPRSDLLPNIKFLGALPLKSIDPDLSYPSWWPEVTANSALPADSPAKKKLVFVSQGTVHHVYEDLILPTINTLARRDDLIVIATLGIANNDGLGSNKLPSDFVCPANTKILDYFPYDAIMPYADLFVCNAGFGGFCHGLMNGVPMILAGVQADKAQVCARGEYCGIAIDMKANRPTEQALGEAVDKVLGTPLYKQRAMELKEENEKLDALGHIERLVAGHGA